MRSRIKIKMARRHRILFLVLFLVLILVVLLEYCQRKLSTFSFQVSLNSSSSNDQSLTATTATATATTTFTIATATTNITSISASKVELQDNKNSKNVKLRSSSLHAQHDMSPAKHEILWPIDWQPPINITSIIPDARKTVSRKIANIFFSIKTTFRNHATRLPAVILTWMQRVLSSQVHIVTDSIDMHGDEWVDIARNQGIHFEQTKCPYGHHPFHLCCKSGCEFENYFSARESGKKYKWFCHFDDDVYVNVPMLAATLATYHPARQHVYIGRKAVRGGETTFQVPATFVRTFPHNANFKTSHHFAVGAGYCISDKLMNLLEKYLRGDLFYKNCVTLHTVDAVLLGIIIEAVLGYTLTHNPLFNSHYNLQPYSMEELKSQVTISYFLTGLQNYVILPNATFPKDRDPTRFFSYHCLLFPMTEWCFGTP